jgi:hypothetical protein
LERYSVCPFQDFTLLSSFPIHTWMDHGYMREYEPSSVQKHTPYWNLPLVLPTNNRKEKIPSFFFLVVSVKAALLEKDTQYKINNHNILSYVFLLGLNFNTFGRRKWREEPMWWIAPIVTKVMDMGRIESSSTHTHNLTLPQVFLRSKIIYLLFPQVVYIYIIKIAKIMCFCLDFQ